MDGCSRQDPAYRPVTGRAPLAGPFPFQGGYALAIADLDAHPPDELEEGRLSRRALIGAAAVGAAATALPDDADAAKRKRRRRRKTKARKKKRKASVVVVGAGLAGLSAARELRKAGKSVIVIEARNRVGGRTFTKHVRGVPVDVGGQWIKTRSSAYGGPQALITALAKELGVPTFRSYYEGDNIFFREGQRTRYNPDLAQELPPDESFPEVAAVVVKADSLATGAAAGAGTPKVGPGISPEAPWSSPRAAELDAQTAETWIQANVKGARARNLTRLGVQAVLACESGDVSLLYFLFYIASADSLENLISTPLGAQESRFVGGAQQVSRKMAKQLGRRRLYRRSPVRSITQKGRRIVVDSDRVKVTARRVIVAVPPALADRIDYRPQLPGLREQLTQRLPMGSVIKCQAVYDRPFWRSEGLTGFALSDQGPVKLTFDNTPPGGSPGVLLGFVEGQEARELSRRSPGERRAAVLGSLARYFGSQALNPIDYVEHSWLEEKWSRGCYVGYAPPGVLTGYGPSLREPHGRIHWAGTETATRWAGYMDGAVQSGRRAAREVLARL